MSFVTKRLRLIVPANKAKPSPAIGQTLGAAGINMMKFCKDFNAKSAAYVDDLPLRVKLRVMNDGSYDFTIHTPPSSWFVKKMAGVEVLAHQPKHEVAGIVHVQQLYELAKVKEIDKATNKDLITQTTQGIFKCLLHSCKSYGIDVSFEKEADRQKRIAAEQAALAAQTPQPVVKKTKKRDRFRR